MDLRWYQIEAIERTLEYVEAEKGNPIISLPTGAGKSLVLSELAKRLDGNVLILSHVQEILEQNLKALTGEESLGLYSAGLGIKHVGRVTVGGIQSVFNDIQLFKNTDYIIIDECHMVNEKGRYFELVKALNVPVIGLTASPFRLREGYLHNGPIFTDIVYSAPLKQLIKEGFLCPIKTYGSADEFDTSNLRTVAGDFSISDMSLAYNREAVTSKIVEGLKKYKEEYKHWLLFCIDIDHAEQVAKALNENGIISEAVHSQSPRDQALIDFKEGRIQAIANVNILTTGFDFPNIDLIVMLRPTKSPVLHVQAIGRGLRMADGKTHCMVKDYAGNFKRLGPIDGVYISVEGKSKKGGTQFFKTCPDCEALLPPAVRECECGHIFKFKHNLDLEAYKEIKETWYNVDKAFYTIHVKKGSPPSLKITYLSGLKSFTQYVLLDHDGYPGYKARWWLSRHWASDLEQPKTVRELFEQSKQLKIPTSILVEEGSKYPIIKNEKIEGVIH